MRIWIPLALAVALSACAPLNTYYREGAPVKALVADETACQVDALAKAPVANEIRREPPYYVRERRVCKHNGNCSYTGGYWIPGEVYTVDVNAPLRTKVERQCMAAKGYSPVEIPVCPPRIERAAPKGSTTILPRLSEGSCVIRNEDGSFQIVTAG